MLRRLLSATASHTTQRAIILFSFVLFLSLGLSIQYSVVRAANFTVNSILDPGDGTCDLAECTLREAITDANSIGGADTITFNIAGGGSPQIITLSSPLPDITETLGIDGSTQTGAACAAPPITLDGGTPGSGFSIAGPAANGSRISGFVITSFGGSGIALSGADNNQIVCNNIGGLAGNSGDGINITNSSNNVIGGAGNSNQIAFNSGSGVNVASGSGNQISQNNIFANGGYIALGGGGANNDQAAPALTLAEYDTTNLTVTGTLTSTASTTFDLEYFVCDGTPEAGTFIGGSTVTTNAGGTGAINDSFAATLSSGAQIAVTATDPAGNTSQFSNCLTISEIPIYDSTPVPNDPTPINIGSSLVGVGVTRSNTVTISNIGAGGLTVSFAKSGPDAADFTIDTPASTVFPGTPLDVAVTCTPSAVATLTATLTVTHNGTGTPISPVTYELECTGTAAAVPDYESVPPPAPDPDSIIDMGSSLINVPIDVNVLQVSNQGGALLTLNTITVTGGDVGDFTVLTAPTTLGLPVDIFVRCTPTAAGLRTTTLVIDTNDTTQPVGPPSGFSYTLECTGDPGTPEYTSNPAVGNPIDIGNTPVGTPITNANALVISNIAGTGPLNITGIGLSGGDVAEFTLNTPTLTPIAIGGSSSISISCDPTTTGTRTTTLTLSHDAPTPASPITYTVNCIGDPPPAPTYSSNPAVGNPIDVGNTPVGTPITNATALTINNTGTAPLNITGIGLSGGDVAEFTLNTPTLAPIAAAGFDTISISCNPTTTGIRTTTLTLSHDAPTPASPITYTVNCTGDPPPAPAYSSVPAVGSPIDIGNTPVGTPITNATALTINNTGTAPLNITGIGISGGDVTEFTLNTPTLAPIAPAGSASISISCNPTTTGTRTTTLTLLHDAPTPASPITYTVNCTGDPVGGTPIYDSAPAPGNPIDVGNTPVGTPITNATALTISNTGTAPLNITGIGLSGGDIAEFTLNTPTLAPIAAAGSASISISCNPTTTSTRTTTLTLSHDAPTPASPITYTVNCTGDPLPAPAYSSVPAVGSPINVGTTVVGTPITNATALTINNTGTAPLNITGIGISGGDVAEFTLNTPTLAPIAAAGSANISISCNPTVIGTRTTTLTLSHDAPTPASPISYTVNCTGTTTGPIYTSVPAVGSPINVGTTVVGTPITNATALTINNTGTAPLNITAIGISGGQVTNFTLNTTTIAPIAPGGSATVSISCNPSAAGLRSTILTVTHNAPGSPTTYTVNCTGTTPGVGAYASSPVAPGNLINVGTVQIGTAISFTLTASNVGTAPITVGIPSITGINAADFAVFTNIQPPAPQFPFILNANGSQAVTIRCIPSAAGMRQATLTLPVSGASNLTSAIYILQCVGSGTPVLTATPIGFVPTATVFVPTTTPVLPATGTVGEVKGLALRTGPYLGATLIGKAIPGTPYPILAQSNDEGGGITWYLITVDTVTGWVSGLYLNVSGNIGVVPFQGSIFDQIDGAPDIGVTARAMSIIDIRRRPSGRAAILTQVPQDGILRLLGRTRQNGGDFWVQVNYNGVIGWIPAAPIAVNGHTGNVPIR